MLNATSGTPQTSATDLQSYWLNLDGGGTKIGTFNAFVSSGNGEVSLANLATTGGSVTQYLYYYPNSSSNSGGSGLQVAELVTTDGVTTITSVPATVPVPATFLLFGSGLLGLVGIRRKKTV
jgi:hypothetical protein